MSNKFTITSPSYDRVYDAYAWRNNNLTLALVQGEGISIPDGTSSTATVSASRTKAPRFQLRDDRGVISLSSDSPEVFWAIKRPNNTEDMVACNIVTDNTTGITAADGVIEIPITASSTQYAGDVYGEIRVITSNGVIKFYGINASVQNGVSDDAAAQSSEFTALMQALQKVVAISTSGTANMATLHSNGELRESTDPISSANLKTFLESNYLTYLRSRFTSFKYAHEAHSSSYDAETNPVDTYNDTELEGVYIDEATDMKTCYIIKNSNGSTVGLLISVAANNLPSNGVTQIALYYTTRGLQIRRKHGSTGLWDESWTAIESQGNKDAYDSEDTTYYGISNDATKYPSSKSVRKFIDAILALEKDTAILGVKTLTPDETYNMHKDLVETYLSNSDYSDDTDYTTSALTDFDFGYETHGRPNKILLTIPTGGVKIEYCDTVTGRNWVESTASGSISYVIDGFYIQNLIPGHLYTYVIYDVNGKALKSGSCLASGQVRMINAGGDTFNIRDLGGWACDGGSIKYGKLYRGAEMNYGITITGEQQQFIKNALGVDDDVDLRSEGSIPSDTALGIGVDYSPFPLSYSDIVVTEGNVFKPASVIKHIAKNLKDGKTSYIHCRAGADRTGTVCLLLEAICGVSQNDIDRDYELTSFSMQPNYNNTRALRLRTSSFIVQNVGDYALKATIATFKSMEGTSLHDKIRRFLLRNGVTIEEMNTIRNELIDGTPSKLVSPYGSATVSRSLSNATMDNSDNTTALYQPYRAAVKALDSYKVDAVSVTMGGSDVSNYYNNGVIEIPLVTGNLSISVTTSRTGGIGYSFTCLLSKNDWDNNEQTILVPSSYVASGSTIANVYIDSVGQTQLIQDGCIGIYLSTTVNNGVISIVAYAVGNTPTENITAQVVLSSVVDISE